MTNRQQIHLKPYGKYRIDVFFQTVILVMCLLCVVSITGTNLANGANK